MDIEKQREKNRIYMRALRARDPEAARRKMLAWVAANPEKNKASVEKSRLKNKAKNAAKRKAAYVPKPRKERTLTRHEYYLENKHKYARATKTPEQKAINAARVRLWHKENPEKRRALKQNRRARLRECEGTHSGAEIASLLTAQKHKCAFCRAGIRKMYHADHRVPLSRGGTNWIRNIQLLCGPCNMSKSTKDEVTFAQERGLLL